MSNRKGLPYEQCIDTEAYKKARMQALVRDNFTCRYPGCECGRLHLLTAHHNLPRSEGGTHELDNLSTVCIDHHERIHATEDGPARFREMLAQQGQAA